MWPRGTRSTKCWSRPSRCRGGSSCHLPSRPISRSTSPCIWAPPPRGAENVTVSFPDYIKNVASSEIYPTWEPAALRANILAQISFALNRVYTEYYPSRGYTFHITNSTATDQKFYPRPEHLREHRGIVDEIFDTYIRRIGYVEPLSARFCNGTTVTCDGLSQWGSQSLAEQGYNSFAILQSYYGDNIELVTDAPVRGVRASYPGAPSRRGDAGEPVVVIQTSLNRISQDYPAIPKIYPVDGVFGPRHREGGVQVPADLQPHPRRGGGQVHLV